MAALPVRWAAALVAVFMLACGIGPARHARGSSVC